MTSEFNNNKISPIQYFALTVFLSNVLFAGIGMSKILSVSKYDSWLSVIIGFILGIPFILLIRYMNKYNLNFFELTKKYFGKVFSKIIDFLMIIFLFFILIVILNDFINFANLKYLFETPNIILSIYFVLPMLYIISKGNETIARASLILLAIGLLIHIINSVALIKFVEIDNLKPFLKSGIMPVIKGAIYYLIYTIVPIIFLSIIPKNNEIYKKYNKSLFSGYILSSFITLVIIFFITTVYNYQYINLFHYPAYFTIKKIEYGFISNAENVLSFMFIIDFFVSSLVLLYIIFYYLKKVLKSHKKVLKISNIIIILLVLILPVVIYKTTIIARVISEKYLLIISLIFMVLYFIVIPLKIKLTKKDTST